MFLKYLNVLASAFILLLLAGCGSAQNKDTIPGEYSNVIELTQPDSANFVESNIYVDSVKTLKRDSKSSLLVMGNLPDGCTNIGQASHAIQEDRILLTLQGWRTPDQMCTQALVSFSFIYHGISEDILLQADSVRVNEINYPLNN